MAHQQNPETTIQEAQRLARQAHYQAEAARQVISGTEGGSFLLREVIDPLLYKEREVSALRDRLARGGPGRACDGVGLERILSSKEAAYRELVSRLDWESLPYQLKIQVSEYVQARRRAVRFGDAERIRQQLEGLATAV